MEQPVFAVRRRCGEADELGEVTRAWDGDSCQIDRGRLANGAWRTTWSVNWKRLD